MIKLTNKTKKEKIKIENCPKCKENLLIGGIFSKLLTITYGARFDVNKVDIVQEKERMKEPIYDSEELLSLCFHCAKCGEKLGHIGENGD